MFLKIQRRTGIWQKKKKATTKNAAASFKRYSVIKSSSFNCSNLA